MENSITPEQRAQQIKKQKEEAELRRKKRRKQKVIAMSCGCAAIVLLAVGSGLLSRYNAKKQAEEDAKSQPQIAVAALPTSGSADTLTFTDNTGVERSFVKNSSGQWSWADDSEFPVNGEQLDTLMESITQLKAYIQFTAQDGQEYGLQQPQQTVTLADSKSGEANTLTFGAVNDVSGQMYLQSGEDSNNLYSVDTGLLDTFDCSLYDLMTVEQVPMPEGSSNITGFSVQSPDSEKLQFASWDDAGQMDLTGSGRWSVTQGEVSLPVDSTTGTTLLNRLIQLQPDTCVKWKPDEVALTLYGLNEDARTVLDLRYTDADEQAAVTRVFIGSLTEDGENCYMAVEGLNGVYLQSAEKLQGFVQAAAVDFATTMPFAVSGDYLTGLSITREGETVLILQRKVVEQTDEEGNVTEATQYTMNGETLTGTKGSSFVSVIAGLTGTDLRMAESLPENAEMTVTLQLQDRAQSGASVYFVSAEDDTYTLYYTRGVDAAHQYILCCSLAAADWQSALDVLTSEQSAD